jgi:predicted lipase
VTGHSLGAALAVLCALDLKHNGYSQVSVINLGQPRVGNQVFAQYYNETITDSFRMVNQRDWVPHLPPRFIDFYHVPTEVWFQSDDYHYVICDESGEDPSCSDSLDFPFSIYDHEDYFGYYKRDGFPYGC